MSDIGIGGISIRNAVAVGGFLPESGFTLSGVVAEDNTLTITDSSSRFGTKPGAAAPLAYYEFGKTGVDTAGSESRTAISFNDSNHSIVSGGGYYNGASFAAQTSWGGGAWVRSNNEGQDIFIFTRSDPRPLIFYRIKNLWTGQDNEDAYPGSGSKWNYKWMRFRGAGDGVSPQVSILIGGSVSGSPRMQWDSDTNDDSEFNGGGDYDDTNWHWYEMRAQGSSQTHAIHEGVDGLEAYALSKDWSSTPWKHLEMFRQQFAPGIPLDIRKSWIDMLYIDDSPAQVYISDQSTWDETTKHDREIQIPTSWAAGEIQIKLRAGGRDFSAGNYLYARTNDNTILKIGQFA